MEALNAPFNLEEITDVRIIVEAKGKHWSMITNKSILTREDSKTIRIEMAKALLAGSHIIVTPCLETIKELNLLKQ